MRWNNWKDHAFGLNIRARASGLGRKIPMVLGEIAVTEGVEVVDTGLYKARNTRLKTMGWVEYGLSYGKIWKKEAKNMFTAAVNLNRLIGVVDLNVIVRSASVTVVEDKGILNNLSGKFSYAVPLSATTWKLGKGWGINAGMNYKKMKEDITAYVPHTVGACTPPDYEYKIGVSLLDLGYIRFKENSMQGEYDENTDPDTDSLMNILDGDVENSGAPETKDRFTAMLPLAISGQFDYNIYNRFYANATIVQKIGFPRAYGTERANLLAVSARYENKWIGFGLPITLQDYRYPQIGAMLRAGPLIIGTDHIGPFFKRADMYAADVFFYLQIPIYMTPKCIEPKEQSPERGTYKHQRGWHPKRWKVAKCPSW